MTIKILTINNENDLSILRQSSIPITSKEELNKLLPIFKEMKSILKPKNQNDSYNGLGLALPQIGILKNGFIMRMNDHYQIVINPKILNTYKTEKQKDYIEGCLSDPGNDYIVIRHKVINVVYKDEKYNIKNEILAGLDSEVFQHEFDHLAGILISDIGTKIEKIG